MVVFKDMKDCVSAGYFLLNCFIHYNFLQRYKIMRTYII